MKVVPWRQFCSRVFVHSSFKPIVSLLGPVSCSAEGQWLILTVEDLQALLALVLVEEVAGFDVLMGTL